MKEKCSSCGLPTHRERMTILKDNRKLCFECMQKEFKVIKLVAGYFFEEEPKEYSRSIFRVVKGSPLYKRKKVFKRFKDSAKRGMYSVEQKAERKYLYEH
jgi:uncharacterized protein with ATP-grasp and redox domains